MPNDTAPLKVSEFKFERRDNTPEFFADGISDGLIGAPLSKITFHTVLGVNDAGVEERASCVRIVMSTASLLEMCRGLLAQAISNKDILHHSFELAKSQLDAITNGIEISPMAVQTTQQAASDVGSTD